MDPPARGGWARQIVRYLGCCVLFLAIAAPVSADDGSSHTPRRVTAGVPKSFPPYFQVDDDGVPSGFAIAVMAEVAKRAGLEVSYRVEESWTDVLAALRAGTVDIIPSLGITEQRTEFAAFTSPVETFHISLFIRSDTGGVAGIGDLAERKVAVVASNAARRYLETRGDIVLRVYERFTDALFALLSAKVDAFAYPEPVTWKLAREIGVERRLKVAGEPLLEIKRGMAVRKDMEKLRAILDRAVRDFTGDPEYQAIYVTWFGTPEPYWTATRVAWLMGALMALLFLAMVWWRYRVGIGMIETAKINEQRLRESEDLLNSIFENVPVGLLIKDRGHVVERPNSTYLNWYGFEPDDILGRRSSEIEDFQSADEADEMNAQEREVLSTGRIMSRREDRLFKDGQIHNVHITKFPVFDQQGNITKVGSVSVDLTEQVQAQKVANDAVEEAEQANRAKSEFLAAVSHDLRTPLNAILGFANILSNQYFGPIADRYKEYAEDIESSGEHLLTLVNEILDLSTIEAGKQSLVKERLSVRQVVAECERLVVAKARSGGIDLVTDIPDDLPPLYADKRASKQILLNLLSNAVKYTPEGGRITVSATATERETTLRVADTGQGIAPDKLPRLTDPFTRASADPYLAEEGWGLGLTIAKSLIKLHDGTLDIQSTPGKGTTVTVTLPNGGP